MARLNTLPKRTLPHRHMPAPRKPNAPISAGPSTPNLAPPPLPVDPIYTQQTGALGQQYSDVLAGIGYDRTQIGQSYGFDQAGNLDPSNPYSVAANLQRRYQQGQRGTTNSFAAAGQLYSGATQRNLDEGTYQYSRSYDDARRSAAGAYHDLTEREQRARFDRDIGIGTAASDRLLRLDPAATVPQGNRPAPGGTAPKPATRRVNPAQTKDHAAAGLKRTGPNTYRGPGGTFWHRTSKGTFARGKG